MGKISDAQSEMEGSWILYQRAPTGKPGILLQPCANPITPILMFMFNLDLKVRLHVTASASLPTARPNVTFQRRLTLNRGVIKSVRFKKSGAYFFGDLITKARSDSVLMLNKSNKFCDPQKSYLRNNHRSTSKHLSQ